MGRRRFEPRPLWTKAQNEVFGNDSSWHTKIISTLFLKRENTISYTTDVGRTIELNLGGTKDYNLEVIDTWNMKIVSKKVIKPGKFQFKTKMPFTALRLIAKK